MTTTNTVTDTGATSLPQWVTYWHYPTVVAAVVLVFFLIFFKDDVSKKKTTQQDNHNVDAAVEK